MSVDGTTRARGGFRLVLRSLPGIAISIACLAFVASRIDLQEVGSAVADFRWVYTLAGVLALAAGYCCRIERWAVLLRAAGAKVGFARCTAPFLGAIALNNVLPLRLGDVVRALVFPKAIGVARSTATASLVIERLIDLLTLVLVLLVGLLLTATRVVPTWIVQASIAMVLACTVLLAAISVAAKPLALWLERRAARAAGTAASRLARRSAEILAALLTGAKAMSSIAVLPKVGALSLLVWLGEAGFYGALLAGFGLDATPATALLVMATVTLSTLVPSSPGYVGTFHLAAYGAIVAIGGSPAQAAGFALVSHLFLWASTTAAGALAMALTPQLFRGLKTRDASANDACRAGG